MTKRKRFVITIDHVPADKLKEVTKTSMVILKHLLMLKNMNYRRTGDTRKTIKPSEKYLSEKLGINRSYISKCLKKLESLGLIVVKRTRTRFGRFWLNQYNIGKSILQVVRSMCDKANNIWVNRVPKKEQVVKPIKDSFGYQMFLEGCREIFNKKEPTKERQPKQIQSLGDTLAAICK